MKNHNKGLTAGHLTMLALGTVIGGSFFLGSSVAINAAGPSIVFAYIFGGILVYYILYAMSEMTVANPNYGGFRAFAANAYGEGAGFVVGWVYWTGMILGMSSEAAACSILVRNWFPGISIPLLGSAIIIGVTAINLLGAERLSKLESGLAAIKVFTVAAFIITAALLIVGLFPGRPAIGLGAVANEAFAPGGIGGLMGSMLIVMFSYCGFEIIALAASEVRNPEKTIPKAIRYTVISLVGMFFIYIVLLLPLIPTSILNENTSAIGASLNMHGIGWAGTVINAVLISAILSTMLATMFGLGRMMRSLADERHAPRWLKEKSDVPYRGIITSGACMLVSLWFGTFFPRAYLFLLSSGGFAILFTYAMMMASHLRLRKKNGCPPEGKCQMPGYPYTTVFVLVSLIVAIFSMPFVEGQTSGLLVGLGFVAVFSVSYLVLKRQRTRKMTSGRILYRNEPGFAAEFSDELSEIKKKDEDERG